jgi:hypothetical protein
LIELVAAVDELVLILVLTVLVPAVGIAVTRQSKLGRLLEHSLHDLSNIKRSVILRFRLSARFLEMALVVMMVVVVVLLHRFGQQ